MTWPHNSPDFDKYCRQKEKTGNKSLRIKANPPGRRRGICLNYSRMNEEDGLGLLRLPKVSPPGGNNNNRKGKTTTATTTTKKKKTLLYNLIGVYNHPDRYNFFHFNNNNNKKQLQHILFQQQQRQQQKEATGLIT